MDWTALCCAVNVPWRSLWCVQGCGSSKRLAKKDAALAMLQFISDGGDMAVGRVGVDGNQDGALQSATVIIIIIIIIIILITKTVFIVLSSWHSYCESSVGSYDEYSTVPIDHWPLDQAKLEPQAHLHKQPVNHIHHCHLLLLLLFSPRAYPHFTIPQRLVSLYFVQTMWANWRLQIDHFIDKDQSVMLYELCIWQ